MNLYHLRLLRTVLLAALVPMGSSQAQAQVWPDRPVKIVLPGIPGSSPDRVTRLIAERLTKVWGQPVVMDYKPGGVTRIGTELVMRAAPDGYTLLSTFGTHASTKVLYPDTKYDPIADFTPIVQTVHPELVFSVPANAPYKSLAELADAVQKRGTGLAYAHFGNGSSFHLYGLMLGEAAHIDVLPVPYRGEAAQMSDLIGQQIESSFNSVGTALPHIRSGAIRPLAVVSASRSKALPEIPTFVELGYPRIISGGWFGVLGPAGLPKSIVEKITSDVQSILRDPGVAKVLREQGLEPAFVGSEEFGKILLNDTAHMQRMVREFRISVN
jgi:tripartite-type tricarboxylate transporter receptor subunit TctC